MARRESIVMRTQGRSAGIVRYVAHPGVEVGDAEDRPCSSRRARALAARLLLAADLQLLRRQDRGCVLLAPPNEVGRPAELPDHVHLRVLWRDEASGTP